MASPKFERGQLILAPYREDDMLWTVLRVAKSGKATLIAHLESCIMEVTTTVAEIPEDWRIVSQSNAVLALKDRLGD